MLIHRPILCRLCAQLAALACLFAPLAHGEPAKEATRLELSLEAAANVNPDAKQRPSPIQVRLIELKGESTLENADYFGLMHTEKTTLLGDLLSREDHILRPGERKPIKRLAHPDAIALLVVAGYHELGQSQWSELIKLPAAPEAAWWRMAIPANKVKIRVQLSAQGIVLLPED